MERQENYKKEIPERYQVSAEFILDKINETAIDLSDEELREKTLEMVKETIMTYEPEEIDPSHIEYIWLKLKFKIKPENIDTETHNKNCLAKAIYIYENFLEAIPEGKDRLPLDEAIENYLNDEYITETNMKDAIEIMKEASKYSKKFEKKLLPIDFKEFMPDLGYSSKDIDAIVNYYREFRNITLSKINLDDPKETKILAKALQKYEEIGEFKSNKVVELKDLTKSNIMMYLTAPEGYTGSKKGSKP